MKRAHPDDLDEAPDYDLADDDPDRDGGHYVRPASARPTEDPRAAATISRRSAARMAARLIPPFATVATAAAGYGAWGLVEATAGTSASGTIALGVCAASPVALAGLRIRYRDRKQLGPLRTPIRVQRIPAAFRRRWWTAGGFFTLWVDAMALGAANHIGWDGMGAILLGGATALSVRWMRDHDVELPTDTPLPVLTTAPQAPEIEPAPESPRFPTPPEPDAGELIKELWETRVAAGPNPLVPGSELGDDREDLPHGYRWIVQLDAVAGNITATRLRGMAEDIALRLERDTDHVLIDRLQDGHARQDRALLTVITRDALAAGVDYRGPRYHDGKIPFGDYQDGALPGPSWTARDETGPQHGMVTGGTGSGKSEFLTLLGTSARKSGEWNVVFTDGHEQGRSAPLLKRIAYDFGAGPADAMEQVEALEAMFHATGELMGEYTEDADGDPVLMTDPSCQEPARKMMPSRGFTGWVWIIDEFHRLVKAHGRAFVDRVERLARIIRKLGGAIWIGTQSALLEDWGDNENLRSLMAAGNSVIMRTGNSTEQLAVGLDFGCDPTQLPKGGGYGFTNGADERKQQFRAEYSKQMGRWVSSLPEYRPAEIPAEVYASKRPPKPADPRADWEETQRRKAAIREALTNGTRLPWEPEPLRAAGEQDEPQPPVSAVGGDGAGAPGAADPAQYTMGGVGIAQPILGPMFADKGTARQWGPLTQPEQLVLAHLVAAGGPRRNLQIREATGLSEPAVSKAFSRETTGHQLLGLVPRGYAVRRGQGQHEATAAGRTASEELTHSM